MSGVFLFLRFVFLLCLYFAPMQYTLLILSPPDLGNSALHALRFAESAINAGHSLRCVFFYDAGALTALSHCEAASDELDIRSAWSDLAMSAGITLSACVASAARYGIGDGSDSGKLDRLLPGFEIAGLGELVTASAESDRLMTFGDS